MRHATGLRIAAARDGSHALIGYLAGAGGHAFLARTAGAQSQVRVIDLESFHPDGVAVTADGRMWTIGEPRWKPGIPPLALLGFDPSGKQIVEQRFVLTPPGRESPYSYASNSLPGEMVGGAGRIGWLTRFGVYVEFNESGQITTQVQPPSVVDRRHPARVNVALSDRGDVVLSTPGEDILLLWWLDRATNRWTPIEFSDESDLEPASRVLGFDGPDLVILEGGIERGGYLVRYRRK